MNRRWRFWAITVAASAAASLLAQFAFAGATWRTPLQRIASGTLTSFVFSMCCAALCIIALPRLSPRIFRRLGAPFNWALLTALITGLAAVGSLVAMVMFWLMGILPARQILRLWAGEPLKVSVITTLLFGLFFTVIERIRTREADARRAAAEAQLASLESRVQPHFLFNTLNSIASLIPDDPAGAERMTGQLATLLRSSLDQQSTPLVSIDDELKIVRNYLDIEQMRFGARLRYAIDVDPGVGTILVPRLAVQTLVENSVKYAVSPRREGASIAIRASAGGGRATVGIVDDGPGFDPAAIPSGHGLALVRERLLMTLGDAAALDVESAPGRTAITLRLPLSAERRRSNCERS